MELFKNKPYAACGLVFVLTAVICAASPTFIKSGFAAVGAGLFLCALFCRIALRQRLTGAFRSHYRFLLLSLLYVTVAAAGSYFSYGISGYYAESGDTGGAYPVTAKIVSVETSAVYGSVYGVRVEEIDGRRVPYLSATLRVGSVLERGDVVEIEAAFADDGTDFACGIFKNARTLYLTADDATLISQSPTLSDRVFAVNSYLTARLAVIFGEDTGGLAAALFLGNKEYLAPETERDFRRIGVSHMLALSGMHLVLLSFVADRIFIALEFRLRGRHIAVILLTLGYMLLCGMTPSITRAGLMLIFTRLSNLGKRKPDSFTGLMTAAVVMLTVSPSSLTDVGFQLSFTAMLAIEITVRTRLRYRIKRFVCGGKEHGAVMKMFLSLLSCAAFTCITTFIVLLVMLPLSWLYFGELSLLSPLCNLLFSPIVNAILYITPVALLFSPFPCFVPLFDFLLGLLADTAISLAGKLSVLRGVVLPLSNEFSPIFACVVFAGVAVFLSGGKKLVKVSITTAAAGAFLMCAVSVCVCLITADDVYVLPLDYDGNDLLLFTSGDAVTVTDVTDGSAIPMRKAVVMAKREGYTEIENIVYTHLHSRHATTLRRICRDNIVRSVFVPIPESEDEKVNAQRLAEAALSYGVRVIPYARSYSNACDIGSFSMVFPPRTVIKRSTHPVIMFLAVTNVGECVYIGSAVSESTLDAFAEQALGSSEVVVFGSHGPAFKQSFDYTLTPSQRYVYLLGNSQKFSSEGLQCAAKSRILLPNADKTVFINPGAR